MHNTRRNFVRCHTVYNSITTVSISTSSVAFSHNLKQGDSSSDIAALQAYLEKAGFGVGKPGKPGSKDRYTNTFGPSTKSALKKFQKAHGIPATGNFGDKTRTYINSH